MGIRIYKVNPILTTPPLSSGTFVEWDTATLDSAVDSPVGSPAYNIGGPVNDASLYVGGERAELGGAGLAGGAIAGNPDSLVLNPFPRFADGDVLVLEYGTPDEETVLITGPIVVDTYPIIRGYNLTPLDVVPAHAAGVAVYEKYSYTNIQVFATDPSGNGGGTGIAIYGASEPNGTVNTNVPLLQFDANVASPFTAALPQVKGALYSTASLAPIPAPGGVVEVKRRMFVPLNTSARIKRNLRIKVTSTRAPV